MRDILKEIEQNKKDTICSFLMKDLFHYCHILTMTKDKSEEEEAMTIIKYLSSNINELRK